MATQGPTGAGGRTRRTVVGFVKDTADWPGCICPPCAELGLDPGGDF